KMFRSFRNHYEPERQFLEPVARRFGEHVKVITSLDRALQPIKTLPDGIPDAQWLIVQAVKTTLDQYIRDAGLSTTISPDYIADALSSAMRLRDELRKVSARFRDMLATPIDSRVSQEIRREFEDSAPHVDFYMQKFENDCEQWQLELKRLEEIRTLW